MKTETETAQSNAVLDCFWFSFSCFAFVLTCVPYSNTYLPCHPFETLVFNIYFIALTTTITTLPPISPTVIPPGPGPGWMVDGGMLCKAARWRLSQSHRHRHRREHRRRRKNPIHNRWTRVYEYSTHSSHPWWWWRCRYSSGCFCDDCTFLCPAAAARLIGGCFQQTTVV